MFIILTTEGATYVGSFKHDLSGCLKPLPPGTKVSFNLIRSTDEFFIMRKTDGTPRDEEKYRAIVSQCCLFVKVCTMSDVIYRELSTRFAKEDIKYSYRKIIVKPITVPAQNQEFMTGNLFPDSENPMKLHFVLVKTSARTGDYSLNPFGFYRKWLVVKSSAETNIAAEVENYYFKDQIIAMREEMKIERERNYQLYKELLELQKSQLNAQPSTSRGKGKTIRGGRGSGPKNPNLRKRTLSESSDVNSISDTSSFVTAANSEIEPENEPLANSVKKQLVLHKFVDATTETIYLKSFSLDINSSPIDQVYYAI